MIVLNGQEVAPRKIKRIQLGNRIVYIRRSKMSAAEEFEFDLTSLLKETPTDPVESEMGFLLEIAKSPKTELHIVSSDVAEKNIFTEIGTEAELYVHITSPLFLDEPVVFVIDIEAVSPAASACEMDETLPIVFTADGNAPDTVECKTEKTLDIDFSSEANTAEAVAMNEKTVFKVEAKAELKAAGAVGFDTESVVLPEIKSEMQTAETVFAETTCNFKIDIEAELWIKPGEWTDPVLKNSVLGISQAFKAEQNKNILKIY